MKRLSEADLLAIRNGETEPLKSIYEAHYDSCVKQMQLKMNSSKEDAEDLMMDTLLILRDNIMSGQFKNDNVGAYLLTVGNNRWRNKIKRDRRLDKYDPSVMEQKPANENTEQHKNNPKVIAIFNAMNEIKGNCNKLLHRNLVDGIPLQTLVKELDYKSYDVIKTTKSRCLKKLRAIVNETLSDNGI